MHFSTYRLSKFFLMLVNYGVVTNRKVYIVRVFWERMDLEREVREMREAIDGIDRKSGRILNGLLGLGLYAMVFATMINSWRMDRRIIDSIRDKPVYTTNAPELISSDVLGTETPESFYEINGQRAYVEIDGRSVVDCVKNPNSEDNGRDLMPPKEE